MAYRIRRVEYFHATVVDEPGEAYKVLSALAGLGVDLVAFTAVPVGPDRTQLTVFPGDPGKLKSEAQKAGMALDGPHRALLVQGDDELGALASVHEKIYRSSVNVYASTRSRTAPASTATSSTSARRTSSARRRRSRSSSRSRHPRLSRR